MPITNTEALTRVIEHREIFHDEMLALMRRIMSGEMSPLMIAALAIGLRVKKETIGEIAAAAQVMREFATPVPTMSTRWVRSATLTLTEHSRMTCAAAVISPMVSFLTRRPVSSAAVIVGDISPAMMRRISVSISSWKISRCSMTRVRASVLVMDMARLLARWAVSGWAC